MAGWVLQPEAAWRGQVGGGGGAHTSVQRNDKETLELVYMQQWENKLKIPARTEMHIKTGLF